MARCVATAESSIRTMACLAFSSCSMLTNGGNDKRSVPSIHQFSLASFSFHVSHRRILNLMDPQLPSFALLAFEIAESGQLSMLMMMIMMARSFEGSRLPVMRLARDRCEMLPWLTPKMVDILGRDQD